MAAKKTINFLPEVFQSDTNRKFLNATMDQLISEPNFKRIHGYVGRRFSHTHGSNDSYLTEPDKQRQNYQLEPSVVVRNTETDAVEFYANYVDVINKIKFYGGNVDNHSRLFSNEFYSYDGKFDFDKFVNFGQYYWLPNGPDAVVVGASGILLEHTWDVSVDPTSGEYIFATSTHEDHNPTLMLAYGGRYKFNITPGSGPFWIQSQPGISGFDRNRPNINVRDVFGVTNNGAMSGIVEFTVPQSSGQSRYTDMPIAGTVDYATTLTYRDLQKNTTTVVTDTFGGLDGNTGSIHGKRIIFVGGGIDDFFWTAALGDNSVVAATDRTRVWVVQVDVNDVITLVPMDTINVGEQVFTTSGVSNASRCFYIDYLGYYNVVPLMTASLSVLYYQNGLETRSAGSFSLVTPVNTVIDPVVEIIGKTHYSSPTGVEFTNGLKVEFDSTATVNYAGKQFYVEGVGTSISLVAVADLIAAEQWAASTTVVRGLGYTANDVLTVSGGTYTSPAKVTVRSIIEDTATASVVALGGIGEISGPIILANSGSGYVSVPAVTISGNGGGSATAVVTGGKVTNIIVNNAGSGYTNIPTITIAPPTTGPIGEFNIKTAGVYSVLPVNPVTATGGSGSGAVLSLVLQPPATDYLTINRASVDLNSWSRSNRWFHIDVIMQTAKYNNTLLSISQDMNARRPIIEFSAGLKLFNHGTVAKSPVNVLDSVITEAFTQVENTASGNPDTLTVTNGSGSITLTHGDRVIFTRDLNLTVRSKIYDFAIVDVSENIATNQYIGILTEAPDAVAAANNCVLVTAGTRIGEEYWFNGETWVLSQQKSAVNVEPKFDIYDRNGISLGDITYYVNSSFTGTALFSYQRGSGANDPILGFPLTYRAFNNIGDIQFSNNYDEDTFSYLVSPTTKTANINRGSLHTITGLDTYRVENIWTKVVENTKQYQVISHVADGVNNLFEIDILPNPSTELPNVKVMVNSKYVAIDKFGLAKVGARYAILIDPTLLADGSAVDILIYSDAVSKMGYYQIPANLDNNSLNQNITNLTLGQVRNHVVAIANNSQHVSGDVPGHSNLRDLAIKQLGGTILKHSAPPTYGTLFLVDESMNFVDSLKFAQKEYAKFKNKFLELSTQLPIDSNDVAGSVDVILAAINGVKNKNFSWYHSDMVPWGLNKRALPDYVVLDPRIRHYEISTMFDDTVLSGKAVLIYLTRTMNGVTKTELLIKDKDYAFSKTSPSFIIDDKFNLDYNDRLKVVEYSSTDGNFVPETPTKLGLHPKFTPMIFRDATYRTPVDVIQGHDGSLTPVFNDFRDSLLIELERRIYNNIKAEFRNQDCYNTIPGKFHVTDYSLSEFTQVLSSSFLNWVGNSRLDFSSNRYFVGSDPWTWNYKKFKDSINGELLPGTWRAIFTWLYDTDRPHTNPWEMLGFSEKPDWWEGRYGPAPYTGGNLTLWSDLSIGYIHAGTRAGFDTRYARPGLMQVIPVDDSGNLRSPEKFVVLDFDSNKANPSYAIGDQGPVETAWRRSSDYPFALQMAFALLSPAGFFGRLINPHSYKRDPATNQYMVTETNKHLVPSMVELNGTPIGINGDTVRASGYLNWIIDYLKNLGIADPHSKVRTALDAMDVQLSYRVGGYTDKNYLRVLAEQGSPSSTNDSVVIPDENYEVLLTKSVPLNRIAYSAVIVERSQNGFTVSGYNLNSPYFSVIPSVESNNAYNVSVPGAIGTIYQDYQEVLARVPYGFEFGTRQQVVDFLIGYQRYLISQGIIFIDSDSDLGEKKDWVLSVKEFLTWTVQGWNTGNVIILSPINETLRVESLNSVVDEVTNAPNGSKVLDPNFAVITRNNFTVVRQDNSFSLTSNKGQTIAFAELNLVQHEHAILFDNKTVFNDIIYSPETGNRQYRLKMIGSKTAEWAGALNPPGFIYNSSAVTEWQQGTDFKKGDLITYKTNYYTALNRVVASDAFDTSKWKQIPRDRIKTGLLPNFAHNAQKFEHIYDINNQPVNEELNFYSNGILGFRERKYLTDLALDIETQSKFYQGFIKQKGTKNAIMALAQARIANINNDVNIYEEWAIRVGEYGAIANNQYAEVILDESAITANPGAIQFIERGGLPELGATAYKWSDLYKNSLEHTASMFDAYISTATSPGLPTAGYVHVDDVNAIIYDLANYTDLTMTISKIGTGYTIWTARDFTGKWNVYRVSETGTVASRISYNIDNIATVSTRKAHNFMPGDIIVFKGLESRFDGFYQVYTSDDSHTFTIIIRDNLAALREAKSFSGSGVLFKLTSSRVRTLTDVASIEPVQGWEEDDKVWVDNLDANGNWGVYNKTSPWMYNHKVLLNLSEYQGQDNFGRSLRLGTDTSTLFVGAPAGGKGRAAVFVHSGDQWIENSNFINASTDVRAFGKLVDVSAKSFIVSAPESRADQGYVFVYTVDVATGIAINQVLTAPTGGPGDKFGASLSVSDDGNWLYIGAPGAGKVYAYGWKNLLTSVQNITTNGVTTTFALTQTVAAASDVLVTGAEPMVPGVDYTIGGGSITFTVAPPPGSIIVTSKSYYKLIDTLTSGVPGDSFGSSVRANPAGSQIVIGASTTIVDGINGNGAVYVYDRSIEGIVPTGSSNTFVPLRALGSIYRVNIDGVEQLEGVNYNVVDGLVQLLSVAPGQFLEIETNYFNLIQKLHTPSGTPRQYLGASVDISANSCEVFAGAPQYNTSSYHSGAVYRFTDQGRQFGTIVGTVKDPTVTIGHSIRINGIEVVFTGTTLDSVIERITATGILGITATNENGHLRITSSRNSTSNRLSILPGKGVGTSYYTGTAISDLGLVMYVQTQVMYHPRGSDNEFFGHSVRVNPGSTTLAVGSIGANTIVDTTFDGNRTKFDVNSTDFNDSIIGSGAVYMYDLMDNPFATASNPTLFGFAQQLQCPGLGAGFNFGTAVDYRNNVIVVGAMNDYTATVQGGSVYIFSNLTSRTGWDLIRKPGVVVDPASIDKMYLYNKKTNTIVARLDHIDPAKGKILGVADQDIDFKNETDPAVYNNGYINYNPDFHWTKLQEGKTWWDTSKVCYISYEQDTLEYRVKHWGDLLPGSMVKVYEWVESSVVPSQYRANGGDGVPKFEDDSNYVNYTYVDNATGIIKTSYYFWVGDKTTVDVNVTGRTNSIRTIQQIIADPKIQGIPFAAAIAPNALNLYNIRQYLTGTDIVLHIDYSPAADTQVIHSEYQLVAEDYESSEIPDRVVNKLQDSLAGIDASGLVVPDPALSSANRTGIEIRPRQTLFEDRLGALENFVKFCNSVLIAHPIAELSDLSQIRSGEPQPVASAGAWDRMIQSKDALYYIDHTTLPDKYRVLVSSDSDYNGMWTIFHWNAPQASWMLDRIQSFNTNIYWTLVDWYASDFISTAKPTHTITRFIDVNTLSLKPGDTILLTDNGEGRFVNYRVRVDGTIEQVGIQHGTLQLSNTIYDLAAGSMGFDNDNFDAIRFDQSPGNEIRQIFSAIANDIFIGDLKIEFNRLFFGLVNYIFSEQASTDWIFKTSFISVVHRVRELIQYPGYVKDNQTFYQDYINEVKPFRSQIREYVPVYSGIDLMGSDTTDFDLPSYYDTTTSTYRSPDGSRQSDAALLATGAYANWNNNHGYSVVELTVANGGSGFTLVPNVNVSGGGGSGTIAHATINPTFGNISSISIVQPGSGYTSTPTVTVNGNGTGAILVPKLRTVHYAANIAGSYNTTRSISSKIKFDRIGFGSNVVAWAANTAYSGNITVGSGTGNIWLATGNLVAYNNELYWPANANVVTDSTFDSGRYQKVDAGNALVNNNMRISGYYQPLSGMPPKDIASLVNGISYPGVKVSDLTFGTFTSNITSNVISFFSINSSIVSSNLSLLNFANLNYIQNQQLTVLGSTNNNRVFRIVNITDGALIVDTATVVNETSGANISLRYLNETGNVDAVISSVYLDTALGTRPEDINVDGSTYVDVHSSHAPEELLPGRTYDTLDVKVFTLNPPAAFSSNVFTITKLLMGNIGSGYDTSNIANTTITTTGMTGAVFAPVIAANGAITSITVTNGGYGLVGNSSPTILITGANVSSWFIPANAVAVLSQTTYTNVLGHRVFYGMNGYDAHNNVSYTRITAANVTVLSSNLNITDGNINVVNASVLPQPDPISAIPGVVFINGEKITYYARDVINNTLSQLHRSVDGTGAPQVHLAGVRVVDSSMQQIIPSTTTTSVEYFTASGGQTEFVCSKLNTTYPSSVVVKVDNVRVQADVTNYPNVVVKTTTAANVSANVAVYALVESPWLNMTANVADGTGFKGAITSAVSFLKSSPSYMP